MRKVAPVLKPLVAAMMIIPGGSVFAQTGGAKIEEVTVTAEKHEESLQNTPIAITALSAETLQAKGITSFEGIAKNSPSINFTPYPSSNNTLILFMRGQGVADPQQITQDGSVGLYEDGIFISRPQATTFDLADVERVEILRGPQGTLYGRNTTGGAVNIISKKPSGEFGFKEDATYGSYNKVRSLTTIDLPKFSDFAAKFTYLRSRQDGTVENKGGNNDFNYEAQNAGRFALRWEPVDNFTADYSLEMGRLDSTPIYYQNPALNGHKVACDQLLNGTGNCPLGGGDTYYAKDSRMKESYRALDLPMSDAEYMGNTLTLAWDVNDKLRINSLTGYRDLHSDVYQNYAEVFGVPYQTYDKVDSHQFSQEFQFVGAVNEQINYVSGLYYFKESASHYERLLQATGPADFVLLTAGGMPVTVGYPYLKNRYVSEEATSYAAYGQVTWTPPILDNRLDLTLGGRFTKDKREAERSLFQSTTLSYDTTTFVAYDTPIPVDFPPNIGSNNKSYSRFNPAFTALYRFTDDLNGYAKVSTGYKAGGSGESVPDFSQTFKPEDVINYELGLKSYWFDRHVRANLAAFYTKVKDLQMAFPTTAQDPSVVLALNAGRATLKGIEVDLLVMPIEDLSLSLEYTGLYNSISKVDAGSGNIFSGLSDQASYFRISNSPKQKITTAVDYTFYHFDGGDVSTHIDYRWTAAYYGTQPTGTALPETDFYKYPSYGVADARINVALEKHWRFGVWGKNIFNKQYRSFVIGNADPAGLVPNPPAVKGGYQSQDVAWADPASFGVDVSYKY
jgi:iron complex outermembrane receptor protein